ncbi:hypothetical protein L596_022834 [Steinernema carpocapsae]|uniref:G-protein coupled receptors family 1 profile domain-containing protein n=1 Tax=Steinernema carpocapsae TaxID=34508 RepID=A0A4V6XVX9_STECR|nr:hypothetical protein L596_022834 [Steinernema carpocapsae]
MEISVGVIVMRAVELCFDLLAPVFNFYFLWLLRKNVFHTHLRVILALFALNLSVMTLTRSTDVINQIFDRPIPQGVMGYVNFAHNDCMTLIMDISLILTVERFIASHWADKYENIKSYTISIGACLFMLALNTHNTYLMHIWLNSSNVKENCTIEFGADNFWVNIVVNISVMFGLNLLSVGIFLVLRHYNMRRYKNDSKNKLTRRFQISENIRTSRQIFYILILNLFVNLYFFFVLYYVAISKTANMTVIYFAQFFDLFAALASVAYPSILIASHPRLRLQVTQQFKKLVGIKISNEAPVQTINNQQMIFQSSLEGSMYFNELQRSWNR